MSHENDIDLTVDLRAYSANALRAALYRLSEIGAAGEITGVADDGRAAAVRMKAADGADAPRVPLRDAFMQMLLEEQVREQVEQRTAPMRELIVREALSGLRSGDV